MGAMPGGTGTQAIRGLGMVVPSKASEGLRDFGKAADSAAVESLKHFSIAQHLRPLNCIIAAVGVYAGFVVARGSIGVSVEAGVAMLSTAIITGAGNMINDFFDLEIDKRQWKETPMVRGNVRPFAVFVLSLALFAAGIVMAFFINTTAFLIAVLVSLLMVVYSALMQNHKYIGNVVVSLGTALTIIFGASIAGNYLWASVFAFSAFLANIGRELTKDLEDMKVDKGIKRTLPMMLGFHWVRRIVFMAYASAVMVAGTAWTSGIVKGGYFIVLLLVAIIVFFMAWEKLLEKDFRKSQAYSKYGMVVSLLAFISMVL